MKKVHRKSYLFLGLAVFLVASVLLFLALISFNEPEKLGIKIGLSVFAGLAMAAGLVYIILFFVKAYDPKELEKK